MFQKLTAFAVQRWSWVLAATVLFCAFGWARLRDLPIEAFPDVTNPMVEVVGLHAGQAAEEMERRVTLELERVLAGIPGMIDLRSVSVLGLSLLTLTFEDGMDGFKMRALVAERLNEAELPEGASASMGPQATPVGQILRYTLRGPRSLRDLRSLQDFVVERRLRTVPGVADVVTFGGYERQYQVRIDPGRLAARGVSVGEVHAALAAANGNVGGGFTRMGAQELVVRGLGAIANPAQLGLALVRAEGGVPVLVRDVAEVVEGSTPRRGAVGRGAADEVVEGIVLLRRGANPSVVLDALHATIEQLNTRILPPDVQLVSFYDRGDLVAATLNTVAHNMAEGVLLVLAVVYLFMRTWRAVVIVAVVIPVSMLTAFIGLSILGLPANLISLGAIDFGILVDGAIIVVESTLHTLAHPPPGVWTRPALLRRAADAVARPVTLAMVIIIVALGPVFSLERVEGRIFAPMAFTYAFALVGALLAAVLVVPALEALLFKTAPATPEPRWLRRLADAYAGLLRRLRPVRWLVLGGLLAGTAALTLRARHIGSEFLPELNEGGLYVTAVFPATIALDETRAASARIRAMMLAVPEVRDVLSHIGRPEDATQAEGVNNAEFFVTLRPEKTWRPGVTRARMERELRGRLEALAGVQYNFSQPITDRVFETISGIIGQVVVKVRGDDLAQMVDLAEQVRRRLAPVEGVADLALYQAGTIPTLRIDLDRQALAARGLSVAEVQHTIQVAMGGAPATEVWDGERRYSVALRLPDGVRADPEALGRVEVGDPARRITLGEVAKVHTAEGRASIWRQDFQRFVAVKFNVRNRDLGSAVQAAQAAVADLPLPEGTWLSWGGEFQNQQRAMARLGLTLPIALVVIVAILFFNFRRWHATGLIIGLLPPAVVGAVAGLAMLGENFSVSSAVGCIALLGQVVLAGVTLCGRMDEAALAGEPEPAIRGARDGLRPVLATSALALFGLLPAATSHAMGSETQRPFALAIVSGLLVITPLLLLVLPLFHRPGGRPVSAPASAAPTTPIGVPVVALVLAVLVGTHTTAHAAPSPTEVPSTAAQTMATTRNAEGAAGASAADAPVTLAVALATLRRSHPLLVRAQAETRASEAEVAVAGLWSNPELSVDYAAGVRRSSYDRAGTAVLAVSQFIEAGGVPGARREVAQLLLEAARTEQRRVAARLEIEATAALAAWAAADAEAALARARLADLNRSLGLAEARVAAGTLTAGAAQRLRLAVAEAEADLGAAEAEQGARRGTFVEAVGPEAATLNGRPDLPLAQWPPLPALPAAAVRQGEASGAVAVAGVEARAARAGIDLARRAVNPGFSVALTGGFGQAPGQWDVGLGLSVPLPVLDGGDARIRAAQAQAAAADARWHALAESARLRLAAAHGAARRHLQVAEAFAEAIDEPERGVRLAAEAGFREGRLGVVELVDAIEAAHGVARRQVALQAEAWRSVLAVEALIAVGPD